MRRVLGSEVSSVYTSAASVIVESMLPYTLFGVAYVVTLGANSPLSILFLSLYAMFNVRARLAPSSRHRVRCSWSPLRARSAFHHR